MLYGIDTVDENTVRKVVEKAMSIYGLYTSKRIFPKGRVVPFGASEILSVAMRRGIVDCAVIVCDGVGTVVTSNPELVQGIGSAMTGLIATHLDDEILRVVEEMGGIVLDRSKAIIDQIRGVELAASLGFRRIGVTIAGFRCRNIEAIRRLEDVLDIETYILSVCNTCIDAFPHLAKHLLRADLVWASASRIVREVVGSKALLQLGIAIPVYALTSRGKKLVLTYLESYDRPLAIFHIVPPYRAPDREPRVDREALQSFRYALSKHVLCGEQI